MIPIIFVARDEKKIDSFINLLVKEKHILPHDIFKLFPLAKEFSIDQIRQIKKNIIYHFSSNQLYVLYQFHHSSVPAQNAFLKTLEEAPAKIQFILVVDNPYQLASTILSRSRIIYGEANQIDTLDDELFSQLEEFIKSGDLKIIGHAKFQTKLQTDPQDLFNQIIYFFRSRLLSDPRAVKILKKAIDIKSLVKNNNLDSQLALDHLLIFIRSAYSDVRKSHDSSRK